MAKLDYDPSEIDQHLVDRVWRMQAQFYDSLTERVAHLQKCQDEHQQKLAELGTCITRLKVLVDKIEDANLVEKIHELDKASAGISIKSGILYAAIFMLCNAVISAGAAWMIAR